MSSDYYGALAGDIADQGAVEQGFFRWLDEWARQDPLTGTYHDQLRAAFFAGFELAGAQDGGREDRLATEQFEHHAAAE